MANVMSVPKVTVLMSIYNGEQFLGEAIRSILAQTFRDFEFLIIDDGSSDKSVELVRSFHDSRIRLIENGVNRGLVFSLNYGMELARSEYVARMDCDDISVATRLSKQTDFMQAHPEIVVCGSAISIFGDEHHRRRYPETDELIRARMLFESPFAHPTVMFRRARFLELGLSYREEATSAEDYDLWVRLPDTCKTYNLAEPLVRYRLHLTQTSKVSQSRQLHYSNHLRLQLLNDLGIENPENILGMFVKISRRIPDSKVDFIDQAERLLTLLGDFNSRSGCYNQNALLETIGYFWWETCFNSTSIGFEALRRYYASPLSNNYSCGFYWSVLFILKAILKKKQRLYRSEV